MSDRPSAASELAALPPEQALQAAIDLGNAGRDREALALLEELLEERRVAEDSWLYDRVRCNRCAALITLQRSADTVPELREILMATADGETAFLAAYNIAYAFECAKEPKKVLFYARVALDRAERLERPDWKAWCHNQMGNALVAQSELEAAELEYASALSLLGSENEAWRAIVTENLGYCRLVSGHVLEGLRLILRSWRSLVGAGTEVPAYVHVDLAFGYLEAGKPRAALRHAKRGVLLGAAAGVLDDVKNGHFLAAEAAGELSDDAAVDEHRLALSQHFPGSPIGALAGTRGLRPLLNLRA